MITEQEARDLLARAAASIEVDDDPSLRLTGLPEPQRRRWLPLLAVAAAILAVATAAGVVTLHRGDRPVQVGAAARLADPVRRVTEPGPVLDGSRRQSATMFAAWARGTGAPPSFASRVRYIGPGFHTIWNAEPERREGWSACSGLGFPQCGLDPIAALVRYRGEVVPRPAVIAPDAGYPRLLRPADAVDIVTVSASRLIVRLWIDDDGRIYGLTYRARPLL